MVLRSMLFISIVSIASTTDAVAADYTFRFQTGSWQESSNWLPPGIPGAGDTATIQDGQLVTSGGDVATAGLNLGLGAMLKIQAGDELSLAGNVSGGSVSFGHNSSLALTATAVSICSYFNAESASALSPVVVYDGGASTLEIADGGVMIGSFFIRVKTVKNYGELAVDGADDRMEIGGASGPAVTYMRAGTGFFRIGSGEMRVRNAVWSLGLTDPHQGTFYVGGGKFVFTSDASTLFDGILMTGFVSKGTLESQKTLLWFRKPLTLSGTGKLKAARGCKLDIQPV